MLSKQDDFIGHQLPTTFDHVMSSDPAWMERLWYTGHPIPGGDFIFDIGLGWHPNRNVMDGFAGVAFGGKQYNIRVSRRLRPNPLHTVVGPLEIEILGETDRWRAHQTSLLEGYFLRAHPCSDRTPDVEWNLIERVQRACREMCNWR